MAAVPVSSNSTKSTELQENIKPEQFCDSRDSICESSDNNKSPCKSKSPASKTDRYAQNRARNNEAAKISRRNRRLREAEMAIRAANLEQENITLRAEISTLSNEIAALRNMAAANALLPSASNCYQIPTSTCFQDQQQQPWQQINHHGFHQYQAPL